MCQDYITSIMQSVPHPSILASHNPPIGFCIISSGSPHMIQSYKRMFNLPFALYVDPTLAVYRALGMTRRTLNIGPDSEKGSYVKHGLVDGMATVVGRSARVRAPVWRGIGDLGQLGGEFVLGPASTQGMGQRGVIQGRKCFYAHRMTHIRSHSPIEEVMKAAGWGATLHHMEETRDQTDESTMHESSIASTGDDDTYVSTSGDSESQIPKPDLVHARVEYMRWLQEQKERMGTECKCEPTGSCNGSSTGTETGAGITSVDVDTDSYWDEQEGEYLDEEEYVRACLEYADACGLEGCSFLDM
jgi:hypothetical protein